MSPLVADVLTALLSGIVDLEVVARLDDRQAAGAQLIDVAPDLVLLGLNRGESDEAGRRMLARLPLATVVALSGDGQDVFVHEMRPQRTPLLGISADELVAELRPRLQAPRI